MTSKFINQRLKVNEDFIGIYQAVREAENKYGKTLHYIFLDGGGEVIFDSKNPRIKEFFSSLMYGSRIRIRKIFKGGRILYDVSLLNNPVKDEKFNL